MVGGLTTARRIRAAFPILASVLAALAGCTVGPDYHRPKIPTPQSYSAAPLAATRPAATQPSTNPALARTNVTTQPIHLTRWWASFDDPMLDSLVDRAVHSNLDLRLAQARLLEARARRAVVAGGQYPALNAGASYSHQRTSQNAQPFATFGNAGGPTANFPSFPWEWDLYQAGFDASWEVDVFGGARRAIQAANAQLMATEEARRGVVLSVIAEVARNYIELRGAQRQLEVAEANVRVQRETLDVTKDKQRNGIATQLDVSRAAAQEASTEALIPALQNNELQSIHRLALLLGREPGALMRELSPRRAIPIPPPQIAVGIPADLLRRRPDIRFAERQLAAATAAVGVATADLFPRFSLTGSFNFQSSDTENWFDWTSRTFNIGPAIRWQIFDRAVLRAQIQVRDAQEKQALVQYEQTVLGAMRDVEDSITALGAEQRRREALYRSEQSYADAARLARDLYHQGLIDFLTVLEAERSLYQAQEALALSKQAVSTDAIALYKALGGGWEIEQPADNPHESPTPR
jgi:NodT family efflux transporter outer membrane factor (OMF) lipoprotein